KSRDSCVCLSLSLWRYRRRDVETTEDHWPQRRDVVTCACVLKKWREITGRSLDLRVTPAKSLSLLASNWRRTKRSILL
ncbi:unnamed protein product, partial [Brassica oleracea]